MDFRLGNGPFFYGNLLHNEYIRTYYKSVVREKIDGVDEMSLEDKKKLVNYMITKYRELGKGEISPIKIQKGLYFLFAFWGSDVRKQKNDQAQTEIDLRGFDENLFDANFEAWTYGPVDKEIYHYFKNLVDNGEISTINQTTLSVEPIVKEYIDNLLDRIFVSNDFALVDLSHQDKCWSNVYAPMENKKIESDSIISEYAQR